MVRETEESGNEFQHLLYDKTDPSNSPLVTLVGDRNFRLSFYTTDGSHHKHSQELIMVYMPQDNSTIHPQGWHTYGWFELLELKTRNSRLQSKIFRNVDTIPIIDESIK